MLKSIKKSTIVLGFAACLGLSAAIISYSSFSSKADESTSEPVDYEVSNVSISKDVYVLDDIDEMVANSDIAVVGYFKKKVDTVNMLRDPNDPTKESEFRYEEGHVYDFAVDEVLAGDVDKRKIKVGLSYSQTFEYEDKSGSTVELEIPHSLYKEPKQKQKYIMFLYENKDMDTYFAPFEPFRFAVTEDNLVKVDSALVKDEAKKGTESSVVKKLDKTKEEVHIMGETHAELNDTITGKNLGQLKKAIKAGVEKKN